MELFSTIVVSATVIMLLCVFGLVVQLNLVAGKLRKREREATFYRDWAFRIVLSRLEDSFADEAEEKRRAV